MGKVKQFMIEAGNDVELARQLMREACERHTPETAYKKTKSPDYMREKEMEQPF